MRIDLNKPKWGIRCLSFLWERKWRRAACGSAGAQTQMVRLEMCPKRKTAQDVSGSDAHMSISFLTDRIHTDLLGSACPRFIAFERWRTSARAKFGHTYTDMKAVMQRPSELLPHASAASEAGKPATFSHAEEKG